MKLSIESAKLLSAINRTKPATGAGMVVLGCLLLSAANGKLTVSANNLDAWISVDVECGIDTEGAVAVSCNRLLAVVDAIGKCELALSVDKRHMLQIRKGASLVTLAGLPPDEFPRLTHVKDGAEFTLPQSDLRAALNRVLPFVSNDQARYIFCGTFMTSDGKGSLTFVATDGKRLRLTAIEGGTECNAVIPTTSARMIAALCDDGAASVSVSPEMIAVSADDWRFASKLIEGNYPNWKQVIPKSFKPITGEREALLEAVARAMTCASDKSMSAKLTFGDTCFAACNSPDAGESEIEIEGWRTKRELTIAFDPAYLRTGLRSFSGEEVGLQFADEMSPMKIEDASGVFVLMPMRIS